jgi:hypothetical protein
MVSPASYRCKASVLNLFGIVPFELDNKAVITPPFLNNKYEKKRNHERINHILFS